MSSPMLPPKAFAAWQEERKQGRTKYVVLKTLWFTPAVFSLFTIPIYLNIKFKWGWPLEVLSILRILAWVSPGFAALWATTTWKGMESAFQADLRAQGKAPPPLPVDQASGVVLRNAPQPPVIFTQQVTSLPTLWTCANPTRLGIRLMLMASFVMIVINELPAFQHGDSGPVIVFSLAFLALVPRALEGGCQLDRTGKRLRRWYGVPLPFLSRNVNFADIRELRLANGKRPDGRGDTWCHIAAVTDSRIVLIKRFDYRPEARKFAENLAREVGQLSVTESK